MPKPPKPLLEQIGRAYLRTLVERDPTASLAEYARIIHRERGVATISDQTMCKVLTRAGLTGDVRRALKMARPVSLAA